MLQERSVFVLSFKTPGNSLLFLYLTLGHVEKTYRVCISSSRHNLQSDMFHRLLSSVQQVFTFIEMRLNIVSYIVAGLTQSAETILMKT